MVSELPDSSEVVLETPPIFNSSAADDQVPQRLVVQMATLPSNPIFLGNNQYYGRHEKSSCYICLESNAEV